MLRVRRRSYGVAFLVLVALAGCTTRPAPRPPGAMAGMGPLLSVERFLQAANAHDFEAMQGLFGTYRGPIRGDRQELELRMAAIAEVLRHDDYRIEGERREPGREHPTTRVEVTLVQGSREVRRVPFLVVRTESGGWLVEEVDLEHVMRG